jgi:hypothetical protein
MGNILHEKVNVKMTVSNPLYYYAKSKILFGNWFAGYHPEYSMEMYETCQKKATEILENHPINHEIVLENKKRKIYFELEGLERELKSFFNSEEEYIDYKNKLSDYGGLARISERQLKIPDEFYEDYKKNKDKYFNDNDNE